RLDEATDAACERRLAAAVLTDDGDEDGLVQLQRDPMERPDTPRWRILEVNVLNTNGWGLPCHQAPESNRRSTGAASSTVIGMASPSCTPAATSSALNSAICVDLTPARTSGSKLRQNSRGAASSAIRPRSSRTMRSHTRTSSSTLSSTRTMLKPWVLATCRMLSRTSAAPSGSSCDVGLSNRKTWGARA